MFSKKSVLGLLAMVATLVLGSVPAFASPPNCSTGRNLRGYNAGVTIGRTIVQQTWLSVGEEPDNFEDMAELVRETVADAIDGLPPDASDYTQCRAKGLAQGVCDQLGDIQDSIVGICVLDGEVWGDLSAGLYCALSLEFGPQEALGLTPVSPAGLCGQAFESSCKAEFDDVASATATCSPFIAAPNDGVYADWRLGMCAYEL